VTQFNVWFALCVHAVILDVGHLTKTLNFPAFSFAGQSIDLRKPLYRPILRTMGDGGWLATALLRMMDYFKVSVFTL